MHVLTLSAATNFSLYSNLTNTMFLSKDNAFTFYNCSLGVRLVFTHSSCDVCTKQHCGAMILIVCIYSCSVCVETEGNCGWCPYNFTCSLQSSDNDSSSSILTVSYIVSMHGMHIVYFAHTIGEY